jgi:hypothetical protein
LNMIYYQVKKEYGDANVIRCGKVINTLIAGELITEHVYNRILSEQFICFRKPFESITGSAKAKAFTKVEVSQRKTYNCFGVRKADDCNIKIIG